MFSAPPPYPPPPTKVWWIIWSAILIGLLVLYVLLGRSPLPKASSPNPLPELVGLIPLFISIVIRWLMLPRSTQLSRAFILFILGLSLAEGCGILGIFLGGPYRDSLFVLGVLGVTQYVPFFAKGFLEPKPQGFIPNN